MLFRSDLYEPAVQKWRLPIILSRVHRYACDLNRIPEDIDQSTVEGSPLPEGKHSTGLHWKHTMHENVLLEKPISRALHDEIVQKYFDPFHERIIQARTALRKRFPAGPLYHLDCHSMPSHPTSMHTDLGKGHRAEVVLSDQDGKTASNVYREIVGQAFTDEGFQVTWNDPYKGGRITQRYGRPAEQSEIIQIELRRDLYMDERTFEKIPDKYESLQESLSRVISRIVPSLLP